MELYGKLLEVDKERKKTIRSKLLHIVNISEDFFKEGKIKIDTFNCRGIECRLCIKVCPTHALYWNQGEVKIENNLCIYCGACVLNCIQDNCITIVRKRKTGEVEQFRTPRQVMLLMSHQMTQRRTNTLKLILTTTRS